QGLIEGVGGELGVENVKKGYILKSIFDKLSVVIVGLFFGVFLVSIFGVYLKASEKFKFLEYVNFGIGILGVLFVLASCIYVGIIAPYKAAKSNVSGYIIKNLPSSINPNIGSNQKIR
ncbi:MAG: hypothetical protein KAR84_08410, partial [Elusimicrobiales bacterium]|nr:hypothetical protein [Elusimicrobiales bacterium]